MEVTENFYSGRTPSKTPTREESNRDGHVRKKGRRIRLAYQTQEGPRWQAQDKNQAIREMCLTEQKRHACFMDPDTPE